MFAPQLLRQAELAVRWAGSRTLSPDGLAAASLAANKTLTVKRSAGRHFMYSEEAQGGQARGGRLPDSGLGTNVEVTTMAADEFIARCRLQQHTHPTTPPKLHPPTSTSTSTAVSTPGECVYFTSRLGDPQLGHGPADAVSDWSRAIVDPIAAAHHGASESYPSVWIGGQGSTTQAHYDGEVLLACTPSRLLFTPRRIPSTLPLSLVRYPAPLPRTPFRLLPLSLCLSLSPSHTHTLSLSLPAYPLLTRRVHMHCMPLCKLNSVGCNHPASALVCSESFAHSSSSKCTTHDKIAC
jgi:hypothetical protein